MNKKISVAAAVVMLLTSSVFASNTMLEKTDDMERTVYGQVQQGAIVDRAGQLELTLQGHENGGQVAEIVNRLYKEVEENDNVLTLKTTVNMLQWTYDGKVTKDSLLEKMDTLERAILGRVSKDPLEKRIKEMSDILLGPNKRLKYEAVTIPHDEVFKITINQPLNTEKNEVGDKFTFTVAEDIVIDNLLVVPEGTTGEGVISKLKKARSFGRPAEIDLKFLNIPTVAKDIFDAEQGKEAQERSETEMHAAGASVAGVAILGPIGMVGGFFVKGHAIEYPVNQAFFVQPVESIETYGIGLEEVPVPTKPKVKDSAKEEVNEKAKVTITKTVEEDDSDRNVVENDVADSKEESEEAIETKTSDDEIPTEAVVVIKKSE